MKRTLFLLLTFTFSLNTHAKTNEEVLLEFIGQDKIELLNSSTDFHEAQQQYLIINFWASWCTPCIAEFKSMKKLLKKRDDIYILGVNVDQDEQLLTINKTIKRYKLPFAVHPDRNQELFRSLDLEYIPASFVFKDKKLIKEIKEEIDFNSKEFKKILK